MFGSNQKQKRDTDNLMREHLADLENYIAQFSNFLPLPVSTVNPVGVIVSVNTSFERLVNSDAAHLIGQQMADLFLESQKFKTMIDTLTNTKKFTESQDLLINTTQGQRTVQVTVARRIDSSDETTGYFVGLSDITELKNFQTELERKVQERTKSLAQKTEELEMALSQIKIEQGKTESIIENFSDALIYLNPDKKIEIFNPQAEIFFNVSLGIVKDKEVDAFVDNEHLNILHKMLVEHDFVCYRQALELSQELTVEISSGQLEVAPGEVGTLITIHDISREKMLEKLKVGFVSVAAHQMRTPIAAIKWTFELLLEDENVSDSEKTILEKGYGGVKRVLNLVNELLSADRIESNKFKFSFEMLDLEEILQAVVLEVQESTHDKNVNLVLEIEDEDIGTVFGDREKLRAVLQNLIENAVKYTPAGGRVSVRLYEENGQIMVAVRDSGIGIPPEEQKNIFVKFYRAKNAVEKVADGTGLGLYVAKKIAEKHGGDITFESVENIGTTFYVHLPKPSKSPPTLPSVQNSV